MCQEKPDTFEKSRAKGKRIIFIFDLYKRSSNCANIINL